MKDIENREDVNLLVNEFYTAVLKDELLAPHFAHIDFTHHKPRMVDFWCFTLLDKGSFKGNIFDKHAPLQINQTHFDRWLLLFEATLQQHFLGDKATLALQRAKLIGYTFASKMAQIKGG
jgi:hemoglobin